METGRPLHLTASGRVFKGYFVGFKPQEYLVIEVPRSKEIDAALTQCHADRWIILRIWDSDSV